MGVRGGNFPCRVDMTQLQKDWESLFVNRCRGRGQKKDEKGPPGTEWWLGVPFGVSCRRVAADVEGPFQGPPSSYRGDTTEGQSRVHGTT